jgi:serine/threonine-protein kinase
MLPRGSVTQRPADPLIGSIIGEDFRILAPLGQGGMGTVFLVEQLSTRSRRALKVMNREVVADARLRRRFEDEARAAARIPSDHVVEVIGAGVDAATGTPWLAMELLEGEDLASYMFAQRALPASVAGTMLGQLCHGLGAAHAQGIVHRDLKPENIFVAKPRARGLPFMIKILDFGVAKFIAEASVAARTGAIGTPAWMAPEQTRSDIVTPATDVFPLGLIVFQMLSGKSFWLSDQKERVSVQEVMRELLFGPIPPASARARELPGATPVDPTFDAWFARCFAREPSQRFQNASDALAAWELAAGGGRVPPTVRGTEMALAGGSGGTVFATPLRQGLAATQAPQAIKTEVALPRVTETAPAALSYPDNGRPDRARTSPVLALAIVVGLAAAGGTFAAVWRLLPARSPEPPASPASASASAPPAVSASPANRWVRVDPPPMRPWLLGVEEAAASSPTARGFRADRKVEAPDRAYELQQHEVTWGEYDEATAHDEHLSFSVPSTVPADPAKRQNLPVTGVPWSAALAFCRNVGALLPTESQWEYAARGPERRAAPWDEGGVVLSQLNAFKGVTGTVDPVMKTRADCTPGPAERCLADLMGNAREWTLDPWREDFSNLDEPRSPARAVRGLPLLAEPTAVAELNAAHREALCGGLSCPFAVRFAYVDADKGSGKQRPLFEQAIGAQSLHDTLEACFQAPGAGSAPVYVRVDFSKGSCSADEDGNPVCPKPSIGTGDAADSGIVGSAAYECARKAIGDTLASIKWATSADAFSARVAIHPSLASTSPDVGFRCARGIE